MFRRRAPEVVRRSVLGAINKVEEADETLTQILQAFRGAAEPFSDLDESLECGSPAKPQGVQTAPVSSPTILTFRGFSASLTCPKKFYLLQNRQDLIPHVSIGEAVRLDDGAAFNELARRWDRLQFGSRAVVVHERNFDQAVQRTEDTLVKYFQTVHAQLGEQAPSLTIHRPAFAAPFGGNIISPNGAASPLMLRARPVVLRFRPKDNQWVILETAAVIDPFGNATRLAQCLQRLHFTTIAFRYWITQAHIPIQIRKRFLNIDLDTVTEESLKGHRLESTAQVAVPLDLKRSGLLHIRQFFPGPVTLMDCDPSRLVKYVQRLSLEDMLEADTNFNHRATGAFDLGSINLRAEPLVADLHKEAEILQKRGLDHRHLGSSTSSRVAKRKETELRELFAAQQRLLEALIRTRTLRLIEQSYDAANVQKWTTFAHHNGAIVKATFGEEDQVSLEGKGGRKKSAVSLTRKKKEARDAVDHNNDSHLPSVPAYSEFIGAHCPRGDVCPFFAEGLCLPNKIEDPLKLSDNHLFTLPSTSISRKAMWWTQGLRTVRDVLYQYKKGTIKLTAPQLRHVKAVASGMLCLNPKEIDDFFSRIRYPVFFIDFEATQFALPPFEKVVAYQPTPFQFSIDVFQVDILNEIPTHYDYLHFGKGYSPNVDPRRGCVKELMHIVHLEREKKRHAMEASGELAQIRKQKLLQEQEEKEMAKRMKQRGRATITPKPLRITKQTPLLEPVHPYDGCFIAHFASFEKSCLEKLGQLVDEHKEDIKQFYFLDTLDLFKRGIVHPNAQGSNSLKKVLPALCPDFQYGIFGEEISRDDSDAADTDGGNGGRQDEQKGENAMGVYRLWYHHEGGGSLKDLRQVSMRDSHRQQASDTLEQEQKREVLLPPTRKELRDKAWASLRIQLLEYCSLDTKALYEIMRQVWREKEAVKGIKPDKGGWVMATPLPRELDL
ncbi:hypothetical protein TraAM80_01435 [Trypanosoma rangeli]|uniref:DUF2779 domain-containing protein n=1 Tax=Trypanosoma rangeli TaxID=5698 RepID=A0A3R7MSP9_TRYRA|nr:uncharacterized protein TraAM80_01435 [Trypanosoma rangeli]RNF10619.1 hypothetical protein TraAM80_01435 [Trypanosoma rangeli]|eukprot:RNF10619.1 hypothetical protein TraAM80_01435 [Trypanosoma rangeli]